MWRILPVVASLVCFSAVPSTAEVQGRWCAFVGMGSGNIRQLCHFNDLQSCIQEVVAGDRGHCGPNPYWSGRGDPDQARSSRFRYAD
jgi:hypothetical protein